jgi:hypothetical protein
MESAKTGFRPKYLISWLIVGVIVGAILLISGLNDGDFIREYFLIVGIEMNKNKFLLSVIPLTVSQGLILSGISMVLEAGFRHKWRFNEIRHRAWLWHIYPIPAFILIVIAVIIFAISFKSAFRS